MSIYRPQKFDWTFVKTYVLAITMQLNISFKKYIDFNSWRLFKYKERPELL